MTPDDHDSLPLPAVVVRNEFSVVEVRFVRRGLSVSLVVADPATGRSTVLDATELEALAAAPRESLRALLREVETSQSGEQ